MDFPAPQPHPAHNGGMSDGWRTVSLLTWIGVFGALLSIAVSSRTIGRPIWWLGPTGNPAPMIFLLIPIVLTITPIVVAMRWPRQIVRTGLVCSLALLVTAIADFSRSPAIAWAVSVVAIAALIETIALLLVSRHYR